MKKPDDQEEPIEELDFEDGFGGLPEDLDLTKNIGCGGSVSKNNSGNSDSK
jgi:hypothetical protein